MIVAKVLSRVATLAGATFVWVETEAGSGMSGARRKVRRALADPRVGTVVVEHRDRLGRMNTELVEAALSAHGQRLMVRDAGEVTDELEREMVEVLTCVLRSASRAEFGVQSGRSRRWDAREVMLGRPHLSVA